MQFFSYQVFTHRLYTMIYGILSILWQSPVFAGSGFYYGIESVGNSLETHTQAELTFTPTPPEPSTSNENRSKSFLDAGVYVGFHYKRRRTQQFFWSPEFFVTTLDSNETIYGTSLKFGTRWGQFSPFLNVGVSRIAQFKLNKMHWGIGTLFKLSDRVSLNLEWVRFDTIEENTTANSLFGSQTLTTVTETDRDIEAIKFGIVLFLHE